MTRTTGHDTRSHRSRGPVLVAVAALALAACGGGDDTSDGDDGPSTSASVTVTSEVTESSAPSSSAPPSTSAAPTTEPVEDAPPSTDAAEAPAAGTAGIVPAVSVVPLPATITEVQLPWWTADGSAIVASARSTEWSGMQIVRFGPDGSDLTCLTCGIAPGEPPLMKPISFDDGRRVMVRVGNQTPFTNGEHAVLECTPSVVQCEVAELVPVVVPVDEFVVQPQREFRVAPGGDRVGLTQMRADGRGEPVFVSVVAGLERLDDRYELVDPRAVTSLGELKQFSPDGTEVYVSSFVEGPEAGNGDVLAIDLATGAHRRITWYPDYDEPVEESPDGRWLTVGSARTAELFEAIAQVRRPNVLGAALSPLALYLFNTFRDELLEPWLITVDEEQAGATGLLLNPGSVEAGWEGRMIPNWDPTGTRIVFWEAAAASTAGSADAGSRVVVVSLDGLPEGDPVTRTVVSPDLSWAPSLTGFSPPALDPPSSREGAVSGRMDVVLGEVDGLSWTVTYDGFSDDGAWVIDGTESIENVGGPVGSVTYSADLVLSGEHEGYLRAVGVSGTAVDGFVGRIESVVDGHEVVLELG